MPQQIIKPEQIVFKWQLYEYYNVTSRTLQKWLKGEGYDFKKEIKTNTIPPKKVQEIIKILGEK